MKIYLASSLQKDRRKEMSDAQEILISKGHEVYSPVEHKIHNAWDYPNPEWGLMVFQSDLIAIQEADAIVVLSHGREESTAGVDWEAGYAFGIGKKVIIVEMTDLPMSLMVANGRYATVKGLSGLLKYDWEKMPPSRTNTEQK